MNPDKMEGLSTRCNQLREATSEALSWLEDNTKLVGSQSESLKRRFKLDAVEARKLARASDRPTSMGVFGPSQVGKSFLTGTLLEGSPSFQEGADKEDLGRVLFGEGANVQSLHFLNEVNPSGGQETTGLVTRFTTKPKIKAPEQYPVCLRLMSEIDLVKILGNSFSHDLDYDAVIAITRQSIEDIVDELKQKLTSDLADKLVVEDIYELEQYFSDNQFNKHPISLAKNQEMMTGLEEYYWKSLADFAPYLSIRDRATLYSVIWGQIPEFTDLFIELKTALDTLEHAEWGFVSLDAISNRAPGKTVLHVLTMKHGLVDDLSQSEMGRIALSDGRSFDMRKPVITALASELQLELENACWGFFETTDVLDFPGARSREGVSREKFFEGKSDDLKHPYGEAFLRGKVAVLFDNYSADLDLNILISCHRTEQLKVTDFKHLVDGWVSRTHGADPESRSGKPVNLFMATTWCDGLLEKSFGQDQLDLVIDNKLSYVKDFPQFVNAWSENPTKAFDNSFLIRNPAGKDLDKFYDLKYLNKDKTIWVEAGYKDDALESLDEYKQAFLKAEVCEKYYANGEEKWDAMTTPNDGGVTYLAKQLEVACQEDAKLAQLVPKEKTLRKSLNTSLESFYEGDDVNERVKKRTAAIEETIALLSTNITLVPKFISQFNLGQKYLREIYIDYRHQHLFGVADDNNEDRESIGEVVVKAWIHKIEKFFENERAYSIYRLSKDHVGSVVSELEAGLKMLGAANVITDAVSNIEQFSPGSTKHAEYIASKLAVLMNDYVNYAGCKGTIALKGDDDNDIFISNENVDDKNMPILAENTKDMAVERNKYTKDWFSALLVLTKANASSSKGAIINLEENARLGNILSKLS